MTEELQQTTQQSDYLHVTSADSHPLQPQKSNKHLWIALGIAFTMICLCTTICIGLLAIGIVKMNKEKAPVESVLDTYMTIMAANDYESAYTLLSPRVQLRVSKGDLEKLIIGNNYVVFDGYESLSVQKLILSAMTNTNPDSPQGTVAKVNGTISYVDGFTGQLDAVLEKVDGKWRIYNVNIVVPPDKLQF